MIGSLNRALEMLSYKNIQIQTQRMLNVRSETQTQTKRVHLVVLHITNSQPIDHIYHRRCVLAFVHEADFKMKIYENTAQ